MWFAKNSRIGSIQNHLVLRSEGHFNKRGQGRSATMKKICQLDDTPDKNSSSEDGNKENEVNTVKTGRKSKRNSASQASSGSRKGMSAMQKTNKTSFRKRKMMKLERQLEEEKRNKKRIEELVAYFKNLDAQKLETA